MKVYSHRWSCHSGRISTIIGSPDITDVLDVFRFDLGDVYISWKGLCEAEYADLLIFPKFQPFLHATFLTVTSKLWPVLPPGYADSFLIIKSLFLCIEQFFTQFLSLSFHVSLEAVKRNVAAPSMLCWKTFSVKSPRLSFLSFAFHLTRRDNSETLSTTIYQFSVIPSSLCSELLVFSMSITT